jgi:hypothetical protein
MAEPADDPELAEQSFAARDLMGAYNATSARQGPLRRMLLERLLGAVGEETELRSPDVRSGRPPSRSRSATTCGSAEASSSAPG